MHTCRLKEADIYCMHTKFMSQVSFHLHTLYIYSCSSHVTCSEQNNMLRYYVIFLPDLQNSYFNKDVCPSVNHIFS